MSTHKSLIAGLAGAVVPTVNLTVFGLKLFAIDDVNANDAVCAKDEDTAKLLVPKNPTALEMELV